MQFLVDCRSGEPRIRPLTGREYARLQGATGFPINVGDRQAQMGFGDAVCVPAVTWLARHAFAHLTHEAVEADGLQTRFAESRPLALLIFGGALLGFIFTAWLTYLEAVVIRAWCRYFVASAAVMSAVFLLALPEWRRMRGAAS